MGSCTKETALSYWHFDRDRDGAPSAFEIGKYESIRCPHDLEIYVLDPPADNDRLRDLNLQIRKSRRRQLDSSLYHRERKLDSLREFTVSLRKWVQPEILKIPIPPTGLTVMLATLPVALEVQGHPKVARARILVALIASESPGEHSSRDRLGAAGGPRPSSGRPASLRREQDQNGPRYHWDGH